MKASIKDRLVFIIFLGVGVIFLFVGVILCKNIFNYDDKITTTGTITNISSDRGERNTVHVSYSVNGENYESSLNGYSSSFYKGKEIEIYYDKDNPYKIGTKSLDLIFLIFPGFGLIFTIIGGTGLIVKANRSKLEKKLKESGKVIYANYIETVINTSYTVNGRHPFNIILDWVNPDDNIRYVFRSKNIWFDPENIILEKDIKEIPVYIDEKNIKKYVVDVDSITSDVVDLS